MDLYDKINYLYNDPSLYDDEFANYEDDYSFWIGWVKKIRPNSMLEIGIGNGRLIRLLYPLVHNYEAIELSSQMIEHFKNNNFDLCHIPIYNQDMKNITIKKTYDLIILPFNTFVYLFTIDDVKFFFNSIKKICNKNTLIIIDIMNMNKIDLVDKKKYKLCNKFTHCKFPVALYEKHIYDEASKIITYEKKYVINNIEKVIYLPEKVFFPQELDNLVIDNGFEIVNKLGDYNNEEFCLKSRKQILLLKVRCKNEDI